MSSSSPPPALYRGVSGVMSFSLSLTAVNCVSSLVSVYALGLATGGPAVMVWGWAVVAVGFTLVGLALAEICSAFPYAGGVYAWTGQLAPPRLAPTISYVCGWASYLATTGASATFAYSFAAMCSALAAAVAAPDGAFDLPAAADPPPIEDGAFTGFGSGETVGIALGVLTVWALINGLRIDQQGWVVNVGAVVQVASTIVLMAVVLALAPELNSASFVVTEFYNGTGWDSTGYVVLLGLLYSLFAFTGFDAAGQVAEETQDASRSAPLGMIGCCITTAVIGILLTVTMLAASVDIPGILNNPYVGLTGANQPIVALFYYAAGPTGGAALVGIMIVNLFSAGVSCITATSRIAFALARDGGLPGSTYIRRVDPRTGTPLIAVAVVFGVVSVVLLTTLSSTSAIFTVSSLTVSSFEISYCIPIVLRITYGWHNFHPGKFSLGAAARPIGVISSIFLAFTAVILYWPPTSPVTPASMNFNVAVTAACAAIALVWWLVSARTHYHGPVAHYATIDESGTSHDDDQHHQHTNGSINEATIRPAKGQSGDLPSILDSKPSSAT